MSDGERPFLNPYSTSEVVDFFCEHGQQVVVDLGQQGHPSTVIEAGRGDSLVIVGQDGGVYPIDPEYAARFFNRRTVMDMARVARDSTNTSYDGHFADTPWQG